MTIVAQSWVLAIAMVAVLALVWGGSQRIKDKVDRPRGWLMILAAAVLLANVLIVAL